MNSGFDTLLNNFFLAKEELYNHVGFVEDWVICPIADCTKYFWYTDGEMVKYADSKEEYFSKSGNYYLDEVYKQRFYDKWIYEGKKYTMIFTKPGVDGMTYFSFFDNSKKMDSNKNLKEEQEELYEKYMILAEIKGKKVK
jgi:hypothetical protein